MNHPDFQGHITAVRDATEPGSDLVRQWLCELNKMANPEFMALLAQPARQARPLVLLAEDESGVVGGLFAETQWHWLRIAILAVREDRRSRGIGSSLLGAAEREAAKRGCRHAYVDTMEYQATRFYLAHGFEIAGRIADWDSHGHEKLLLTKRLLS